MRWLPVCVGVLALACAGHEAGARAASTTSTAAPRTEPVEAEASPDPEPEPTIEEEAVAVTPEPEPAPDPVATLMAMDGSESTSIGGPNDGRIEGAIALPASGPGFRSNPRRPNETAIYGTVEMIQALVDAARVVHEALPGGELTINDVGLPEGGPIPHHGSHRAGRDVDVLFYLIDRNGDPMPSVGAFLDPRGRGFDFRELDDPRDDHLVRIDLPRTWRFVQALLEGPHADEVQRIFVVEHLRTLLLNHAERARVPRAIRDRFAELTCQPSYPHDDHLHIRFYCTAEDMAGGCEDSAPTY
ncbi:MAG: penicillin-insensitive murein endopeptidase, partial [Myxococcales bacterium]|nr:penicillin-insensitive murein endopeptidase [Myxococcales bacterium]